MKALADFKVLLDRTMKAENEAYGSTQFTPLDVRAALAAGVDEATKVLKTELRPGDNGAKDKSSGQSSGPKGRALKRNELHQACSSGVLDRVKACAGIADVNELSLDGFTPLFLAVKGNHAEVAEFLLEAGADHAVLNGTHGVPAMHQAVKDKNVEMVKLLIRHGADREQPDLAGATVFDMQLNIPMWSALKNTHGPLDKREPPTHRRAPPSLPAARPASATPRTPAAPKRSSEGGSSGSNAAPAKRKATSPSTLMSDPSQARKLFRADASGAAGSTSTSTSGSTSSGTGGGFAGVVPEFDVTTEFFLGKSANE